jgi:hypothetical protein
VSSELRAGCGDWPLRRGWGAAPRPLSLMMRGACGRLFGASLLLFVFASFRAAYRFLGRFYPRARALMRVSGSARVVGPDAGGCAGKSSCVHCHDSAVGADVGQRFRLVHDKTKIMKRTHRALLFSRRDNFSVSPSVTSLPVLFNQIECLFSFEPVLDIWQKRAGPRIDGGNAMCWSSSIPTRPREKTATTSWGTPLVASGSALRDLSCLLHTI